LVNERRLVCRSALRLAAEYCLTPICIARPFIEHDRSRLWQGTHYEKQERLAPITAGVQPLPTYDK
jgi:hypothetical protein